MRQSGSGREWAWERAAIHGGGLILVGDHI